MRKLLWKFFPPYEVRLTLAEIEQLFAEGHICTNIVKSKAIALAKDADRTVYSIRIDHMKPDQLALILVSNVVGRELQCGNHHIYRGVVSMVGNDMKLVWHKVQSELLRRGYCNEAEVAQDNEWLHKQIKEAG